MTALHDDYLIYRYKVETIFCYITGSTQKSNGRKSPDLDHLMYDMVTWVEPAL